MPKELESLQDRIIKFIINKSKNYTFQPLQIIDNFKLDSVMFHCNDLKKKFIDLKSITRNKSLTIPEINKSANFKNN